jgi:vancomycin permeability regulator SanA
MLIHATIISYDGLQDKIGKADVAVVLGNSVLEDGSLSSWLQGRVDKALDLYQKGLVKKIFVSGGLTKPEDGGWPEGDAMKAYLLKKGLPEKDIIADNKGQNTYLTAKDFIEWNRDQHYQSVIIVSQFYHITRTKYIFRKLGFTQVYQAASDEYSWRDIISTIREVPAFYKYMLLY